MRLTALLCWLTVAFAGTAMAGQTAYGWPETKLAWSRSDERGYEAFVQAIDSTGCATVSDCMAAPNNPLAKDDPPGLVFSADCADLVYMLRAYYAWKKGLPFTALIQIEARAAGDSGDLRTTAMGNRPVARMHVTPGTDIRAVFQTIRDQVSTATFRIDPRIEHPVAQDFFSPAITRKALRPGSAIYNGDGHVVIVTRIDDAGRIHFIDAHPDMTITRGVYAGQFQRGDPVTGAGFHAWRPFEMQDGDPVHLGNDQTPGFSMEQYFGPNGAADWALADFSDGGRNVDFVEFTRRRLSKGRLVYDIMEEARLGFDGLCTDFQDRARVVEATTARGYRLKDRPGLLQGNTLDDHTVWLIDSTPGRDRRLRGRVVQVQASLTRLIGLYAEGSRDVRYRGASLKRDLTRAFAAAAGACAIRYTNSDGDPVALTMTDALNRLAGLSFDPWHCPERRWGATGPELRRCDETGIKARWYQAQSILRRLDRPAMLVQNPTLDQLEALAKTTPPATPSVTFQDVFAAAPDKGVKRLKR
jgi:hypothetical protein